MSIGKKFREAADLCALAMVLAAAWPGRGSTVTNRFGFSGKEIFPIDYQMSHLQAADIDGDGLLDLVAANNARSKIILLINQTGRTNAPESAPARSRRNPNELLPDARFKIESVASEKRISSLIVSDLDSDGRPDIAYFGSDPRELVVVRNEDGRSWSPPRRWLLEDGLLNPNALEVGDMNGDGRPDLLLLGEGHVYWFAQDENHALGEPEKLPFTGMAHSLQALDIQGDGRQDLLLVNWDSPTPFRIRLQTSAGQLGPEIHLALPAIRSYWADDLDGDRRAEIVSIAQRSGRARAGHLTSRTADSLMGDWQQGQFEILPLKKTSKARRGTAWSDLNGDSLSDLLIAEPDSGELTVSLQEPGGSLSVAKTFPSFLGVSQAAVADWDTDGKPDIFVLSPDERQVGVTRFDNEGKISFPEVLPMEGRPLAFAVGQIDPESAPSLAVLLDRDPGRELRILRPGTDARRHKFSHAFKATPGAMVIHDANQDGLSDFVILVPYEKMKILLQNRAGAFDEHDVLPPGGSAEQPSVSAADVDGDGKAELLLAHRNFVRALVLQRTDNDPAAGRSAWSFAVKEQINGAANNSRIRAVTAIRNGTNEISSLFLLDAERKVLTLCDRQPSGTWQEARNIPLPAVDFDSVHPAARDSSTPNSLVFFGLNSVAWLRLSGEVWELDELDSYETPAQDAYLNDVISGDLNGDGRKDLAFLETGKNCIEIVACDPPHQLVSASRWQVFEERTFRSRRGGQFEPREAVIADLTGDGKEDLAVLVHDRIILYPQE